MIKLYLQEHFLIDDLIIDEKLKGKSLGTKLIKFVVKIAEEKDIQVIKLDSGLQRDKDHNFYENLG